MAKRRSRGEGSIYKRSDGLWTAQISLQSGKKKYKYAKTQEEVKKWLLEQRKALADGVLADDNNLTLGGLVDRWFTEVAVHNLKPATIISHESIIRNHVKPKLGDIRLSELKPAHLQSLYSDKLSSGLSKRTVLYIHTIIHHTLDMALKQGLVARNVSDAVTAPKPTLKKVKPLTREEVGRLLTALKDDRLYALYVVFLGLGLRRGEALGLTTDCIDFDNRLVFIRSTIQ